MTQYSRHIVMGLCMVLMAISLTACAATYTKQETLANGSVTKTDVLFAHDWWANLGEPDMMGVKRETVTRDGVMVYDAICHHEPTHPTRLTCTQVAH